MYMHFIKFEEHARVSCHFVHFIASLKFRVRTAQHLLAGNMVSLLNILRAVKQLLICIL